MHVKNVSQRVPEATDQPVSIDLLCLFCVLLAPPSLSFFIFIRRTRSLVEQREKGGEDPDLNSQT